MTGPSYDIYFINNYFASFYKGVLNWIASDLFPRIQYKVLGTYDKSVEYFNKKRELGKEVDSQILPSVTLDPLYDFEPATPEGRFLYAYPNLAPALGSMLYKEVEGLKDQDIKVTPVFTRYAGSFETIFWLHSIYELLDLRVLLFQYSGGYNRVLRPNFFESFIILPDEVVNYETGHNIPIDWQTTNASTKLVDNIGHNRLCIPVLLTPMFKITQIADGSTKYGGDSICEYKLTVMFEYEVNIPTFIYIEDFPYADKIKFRLEFEATSSIYGKHPTYDESTGKYIKDTENPIPSTIIASDAENPQTDPVIGYKQDFSERIIYLYTGHEVVIDGYIYITNPFSIIGPKDRIAIVSYKGIMDKGEIDNCWWYDEPTNKFRLKIEPKYGEAIEFFRYELAE